MRFLPRSMDSVSHKSDPFRHGLGPGELEDDGPASHGFQPATALLRPQESFNRTRAGGGFETMVLVVPPCESNQAQASLSLPFMQLSGTMTRRDRSF